MAEDERQTTRLADAFKQDALRQKAFKQAMLAASAAEKHQQMITLARREQKEKEVQSAVSARKSSLAFQKHASISQLKALEHALLRANPELESLRPRGGDDDEEAGRETSEQGLAGNYGDMSTDQTADKVRLSSGFTSVVAMHTFRQRYSLVLYVAGHGRGGGRAP